MTMGKTCSKSANESELENRRISREIRLHLAPVSSRQSLARPVRKWRSELVPSPRSVGHKEFFNGTKLQNTPVPLRSRGISTQRFPHTEIESVHTSMPNNSQVSPNNISSRFSPSARVGLRCAASSPRRLSNAMSIQQQHTLSEKPTAKLPPNFALKHKVPHSTEVKSSAPPQPRRERFSPAKIVQKPTSTMAAKFATSPVSTKPSTQLVTTEKTDSNIKPVLRQALNLLSALEIQYRSAIVNESLKTFGSLEAQLEYLTLLETLRNAAFAIFELEIKSREAVLEQEKNEWCFLTSWIIQSLEEGRLVAFIEKTEKSQRSSMPHYNFTSHRESGRNALRTEPRYSANEERLYLRDNNLRGWRDTGHGFTRDRTDRQQSSPSIFSYSTPYMNNNSSLNAVQGEVVSNEDLESKIRRQTQLVQEAVSPYSPRIGFSPRFYDYSGQNLITERGYDNFRDILSPRPSRTAPDPSYTFGETSLFEPMYRHNSCHDYSFLNRSTSSKEASDVALKRRLSAILRV